MQNRYVGDVGDFAKYSLLRSVSAKRGLTLGIVWCLFNDESHNGDGRHTRYLRTGELRALDSELHDCLAKIVHSGKRSVQDICAANLFPSSTVTFSDLINAPDHSRLSRESRLIRRSSWLAKAMAVTASCDLVFFDPDNGLEIPSVPRHAPKAGKYIFVDELRSFWIRGQSLLVYHHTNRTASVSDQTRSLKRRFASSFPEAAFIMTLLFRRGSCRHFWVLAQPGHASELKSRIDAMLASGWDGHFEAA